MKKLLFYLVCFSFFQIALSQKWNGWEMHKGVFIGAKDKGVSRKTFPAEFKLFTLDLNELRNELFKVVDNHIRHSNIIKVPNASGELEQFEIVEASNFEPELQERFPEIRAFSGKGITDKGAILKLSYSPQGIQTMVFRLDGRPSEFIEPYSADHKFYAIFQRSNLPGNKNWVCTTPEENNMVIGLNDQVNRLSSTARSTGDLKTMRLAQSVTAEYSRYFGATSASQVNLVLAAVNATLTRCNGCYEKDLAIHLNLISNTTSVFYYNTSTDPYTSMNQWNNQLQSTLTSVIGEANYDIGHLFGATGGGGNAGCIGCVCVNGQKGSGYTSPRDNIPQGYNFDIDYVVHEVGHQLGATHSFSNQLEGTGTNKEVGSGITIMGYAGITNQDVAPHSIDIYHQTSIEQIQTNLSNKTCPLTTGLAGNNTAPVVSILSNYIIPKSTPFALTGSATDADASDVLTYCWEQNDNATTSGANSFASAAKTTGPNWITWLPSTSSTRYFPKLDRILAGSLFTPTITGGSTGANANIEYLSSVARTLKFRLTVRDNCPYSSTDPVKVGQTNFKDMTVTVNANAGPFAVTGLDASGVSWPATTSQTITWSVNNTNAAPISCSLVNILLSTDGGQTFPNILASSTPNDGTESIIVPNNLTTTARIKVEAVGNIFFDINNANFSITVPPVGFTLSVSGLTGITCGSQSTASANLQSLSNGGFNSPINLTASNVPTGTTVTFGSNTITPGASTTVTLNNANTLPFGTYIVNITGTAGTNTINNAVASFVILQGNNPPAITSQPTDKAVCAGTTGTFTALTSTSGATYTWQQSTDGGITWNNINNINSSAYTTSLANSSMNNYKYRTVISTQCNSINSSIATLTVTPATAITEQPIDITTCENSSATFTSNSTGVNLRTQWQVSTNDGANWTDISGATNRNLTLAANTVTTSVSNSQYRTIVTVSTGPCPATLTSNAVKLIVNIRPVVTSSTNKDTVCSGENVTLTASGAENYSWTPINQNGSTVITSPAVLSTSPGNPNTINYIVTGTNTVGCKNSSTVRVTANPLPFITISNNLTSNELTPDANCILTADVTPVSDQLAYQWYLNGSALPGETLSSIRVDINKLGNYHCHVTNTFQCSNKSNIITITDAISNTLFVSPNPNNGIFQVLYNSRPIGFGSKLTLSVFDIRGARVFQKVYTPNTPFEAMNVWMGNCSKGLYYIDLRTENGNKLATGKVIINP